MKHEVKKTFVDNPAVTETFSDSVRGFVFDGQVLRIEFCTTRFGEMDADNKPLAKQYPSCRLVMTAPGMLELYNQLSQLVGALEKDGKVKRENKGPKLVQ